MKINIFDCVNLDVYSDASFPTTLEGKTLYRRNRELIVVAFDDDSPILMFARQKGHSFNIAFYDIEKEKEDISGRFFSRVNYWQKQRIKWMFKKHWLQDNDNVKWLIGYPISFLIGFTVAWITHKPN